MLSHASLDRGEGGQEAHFELGLDLESGPGLGEQALKLGSRVPIVVAQVRPVREPIARQRRVRNATRAGEQADRLSRGDDGLAPVILARFGLCQPTQGLRAGHVHE